MNETSYVLISAAAITGAVLVRFLAHRYFERWEERAKKARKNKLKAEVAALKKAVRALEQL